MKGYIPYAKQSINQSDVKAVAKALKADFLTQGPRIAEFEKKVSRYVGAKYAVAVSNGTAALHLACMAANVQKGDEVITSPNTFVSTANAVLYCGGKLVFADIAPDTANITPDAIVDKLNPKVKGVIPVHFSGQAEVPSELPLPCLLFPFAHVPDRNQQQYRHLPGQLIYYFQYMPF